MNYITYNLTGVQLVLGQGALSGLENELKRLGVTKPLLVTDCGIVKTGIVDRVTAYLQEHNFLYALYDGIQPDPLDTMVDEGLAVYQEEACDGIVSIGGGSVMDTGKCISIMSVHSGRILDYARSKPDHLNFEKRGCPIISIPTTSGTGSEVSQYAVVTNALTHRKTTIATPFILSDAAIMEPEFAAMMSKNVTAYTGMDALAHAIEAYTYRTAIDHNVRISDAAALEAIRLIAENLVKAYEDGSDIEVRTNMQWGALLAGVALNIGAGESHALGAMLSKYYGVCHGISVGIPLPYCMEYSLSSSYERYYNAAKALGADVSKMTLEEGAKAGVDKVKGILKDLNFPKMGDYIKSMDEVGKFSEECAGNSCCTGNRRMDNKEAIETVFRMCLKMEE